MACCKSTTLDMGQKLVRTKNTTSLSLPFLSCFKSRHVLCVHFFEQPMLALLIVTGDADTGDWLTVVKHKSKLTRKVTVSQ